AGGGRPARRRPVDLDRCGGPAAEPTLQPVDVETGGPRRRAPPRRPESSRAPAADAHRAQPLYQGISRAGTGAAPGPRPPGAPRPDLGLPGTRPPAGRAASLGAGHLRPGDPHGGPAARGHLPAGRLAGARGLRRLGAVLCGRLLRRPRRLSPHPRLPTPRPAAAAAGGSTAALPPAAPAPAATGPGI